MSNKIYYNIIERDGWLEYHVSANREEAINAKSLSKRIKLNSPFLERATEGWYEEIELYQAIAVGN